MVIVTYCWMEVIVDAEVAAGTERSCTSASSDICKIEHFFHTRVGTVCLSVCHNSGAKSFKTRRSSTSPGNKTAAGCVVRGLALSSPVSEVDRNRVSWRLEFLDLCHLLCWLVFTLLLRLGLGSQVLSSPTYVVGP